MLISLNYNIQYKSTCKDFLEEEHFNQMSSHKNKRRNSLAQKRTFFISAKNFFGLLYDTLTLIATGATLSVVPKMWVGKMWRFFILTRT